MLRSFCCCLSVCLCLEDAECGVGAGVDGRVGGCCFVVIVTGFLFVCLNVCSFVCLFSVVCLF